MMKAIVIAAAALLVAAGGAGAATQPSASGSGTYQGGSSVVTFSFDASGIGTSSTGTMRADDALGTTTAHVVCLAVSLTAAEIVGGIDTSPVPPGHAGSVGNAMTVDVTTDGHVGIRFGSPTGTCRPAPTLALATLLTGSVSLAGGDGTPPAITPILDGPLSATGWYTGDVNLHWDVSEPESFIAGSTGCVDVDVNLDTPYLTRACTATSSGGRNTDSVLIRRDATPPLVVATRTPANATGWNNAPVTISFSCTDMTSGVATCPADLVLADDGAAQGADVTASDVAGNTATAAVDGVNIDLTPPAVAYTGNAGTYTVDQEVEIDCSATDALSGIASADCADVDRPAYTFAVGANMLTGTATDNAGNSGGATTRFTVVADAESIANLTVAFVTGSPAFQALPESQQAVVERLAAIAARAAARLVSGLGPARQAALVRPYERGLDHLVRGGWLTHEQAQVLVRLASAL